MEKELYHHGILGQKWGKRNGPPYPLDEVSGSTKKSDDNEKNKKVDTKEKNKKQKSAKGISTDELKEKIYRLELEKKYSDLLKSTEKQKTHKARDFIEDVVTTAGKNIATQWVAYMFGTGLNSLYGDTIVNPKKGQKDK